MFPLDSLPDGLPPGQLIVPDLEFADAMWAGRPVLWISDQPVADGDAWRRLTALRQATGLYPVLLQGLESQPDRPWRAGELCPVTVGAIDALTADGVLRRFWEEVTAEEDDQDAIPYPRWPGPAAGGVVADPERPAAELAERLAAGGELSLGLVPAARGADALGVAGWDGPCEHAGVAEIAAVVRSWEDRFGARVVGVGFDTLDLSVAAPPATIEHARHVAAEHHGFCPDQIWQGGMGFEEYAESLIGSARWSFWWD